jgi:lipoprotein-releasing system permease protein
MYKLHLILKYLRKRRIAWLSLIAVMMCTAMVLIVISVMGGWLRMFRASFHGLSGDVIVEANSLTGFPYYQEMIDKIEALPEVGKGHAVPTVQTFGLINITNHLRKGVQVVGYDIDKIGNVNKFPESLHRQYEVPTELAKAAATQPANKELQEAAAAAKPTTKPTFGLIPGVDYSEWAPANAGESAKRWPGMIVGGGVIGVHRQRDGSVWEPEGWDRAWVRLTVVQISPDSARVDLKSDQRESMFWITDYSRTQVYQYDSSTVYVPFNILQRELGMQEQTYTDADTGKKVTQPARTTAIQVRVKDGVDLNAAKDKIHAIVEAVKDKHEVSFEYPTTVETWEESQRTWLDAIENEKSLVTMLFGVISLVAVILILCIFYMIVMEKVRDIGIIKSVGATSAGVAGIFLGYGAAIGIVGAGLGFVAGYLVVHNINWLHTEFARLTGHQIWNPEVYAFDTIPSTMNPREVAVILVIAVVASILGAVVPAIAAARMHPVESLRWE